MANGEQISLKIIQNEIDQVLKEEDNVEFGKCDVSPVVPQGMFLLLKIEKYRLQQNKKKSNLSLTGATTGIGAFIVFIVDAIATRIGI